MSPLIVVRGLKWVESIMTGLKWVESIMIMVQGLKWVESIMIVVRGLKWVESISKLNQCRCLGVSLQKYGGCGGEG